MKKFFFLIIFFLFHFEIAKADSFLLISSPESYVTKENFFASGDALKIIQRQVLKTSRIELLDTLNPERKWRFSISPTEDFVTSGLHKIVRDLHQAKSFGEDESVTLEIDFSTDGRGNNRYVGMAKIHEAKYTLGKNLRGLAIDVLLFGESTHTQWNYIEIRQNSTIPHTVKFAPGKLPTLEEIEGFFK